MSSVNRKDGARNGGVCPRFASRNEVGLEFRSFADGGGKIANPIQDMVCLLVLIVDALR